MLVIYAGSHICIGGHSGHSVDHDRTETARNGGKTSVQCVLQGFHIQQVQLPPIKYVRAKPVVCIGVQYRPTRLAGKVQGKSCFAAALVPVDFHDPPPRDTAACNGVKLGDSRRNNLLCRSAISDAALTGLIDGFQ